MSPSQAIFSIFIIIPHLLVFIKKYIPGSIVYFVLLYLILAKNGGGHYMYFESSSPVGRGDKVYFYTKQMSKFTFTCLSFNYSDYGTNNAASLEVYISYGDFSDATSNTQIFQTKTQSSSNKWKLEKIGISETTPFRVSEAFHVYGPFNMYCYAKSQIFFSSFHTLESDLTLEVELSWHSMQNFGLSFTEKYLFYTQDSRSRLMTLAISQWNGVITT